LRLLEMSEPYTDNFSRPDAIGPRCQADYWQDCFGHRFRSLRWCTAGCSHPWRDGSQL